MSVYVWGSNTDGQAGIASGVEHIAAPQSMEAAASRSDNYLDASRIARVVGGPRQTFVLTTDGTLLTAGDNENNELGRSGKRSLLGRVDALEAFRVTDVAMGADFAVAVLQDGRCASWGRNEMGQLGLGSGQREPRTKPKLAMLLTDAGGIVQIAAGAQHCVALARNGAVFTWGHGRRGQLGDGFLNSRPTPQQLPQLTHRPVVRIVCGEAHTICATVGGNVYSWGDNSKGQLGLNDTTMRLRPELIRSLRASRVSRLAAGKAHSAAISPSGLLFVWGSDSYGQLGITPAAADASVVKFSACPAVVEKLRPESSTDAARPVEVSCGATHTLVLLANGRVFSFGCGTSGQLGSGTVTSSSVPQPVPLLGDKEIIDVSCGGPLSLTSFAFTTGIKLSRVPLPSVDLPLLLAATKRLCDSPEHQKTSALNHVREIVARAYSSIAVLNSSFRVDSSVGVGGGGLSVKLADIRLSYEALLSSKHPEVAATLGRALMQMTECLRQVPTDDPENLSVFLITLENPLLLQPSSTYVALERIVSGILALPRLNRQQLFGWLKGYASEYFSRIVKVVQGYLTYGFASRANNIDSSPAVLVLESLWEINGGDVHTSGYHSGSRIIPDDYFVNDSLLHHVDIFEERRKFLLSRRGNENTKVFNFLNYPFLLGVQTKARFLQQDFEEKRRVLAYTVANCLNSERTSFQVCLDTTTGRLNAHTSVLPRGLGILFASSFVERVILDYQQRVASDQSRNQSANSVPVLAPSQSLVLSIDVRRKHLLDDLLSQIERIASASLQHGMSPKDILFLPLQAAFVGEEGVDAGGVRRELLTLAVKELLQKYQILSPTSDGRLMWFTNTRSKGNGTSTEVPDAVKTKIDSVFDGAISPKRARRDIDEHNPSRHSHNSDATATVTATPEVFPYKLAELFYPSNTNTNDPIDTKEKYNCEAEFALGLLYGFASYNDCLIDLPLPKALYKVLLKVNSLDRTAAFDIDSQLDIGDILTLSDLWECDEALARGLQQLLDFEDGNISDVFGVDFVASENPLLSTTGGAPTVELIPGGADKPVDKSNRALFVERFIQHALFKSVSCQALAFFRGLQVFFFCTKHGSYEGSSKTVPLVSVFEFNMCSASEMQVLLCGSPEVGDISLLRLRTSYKGEYHDEHPVIQWLWDVLSDLPTVDIRRFLMFVTGSDRVPVGGFDQMSLIVQSTRPVSDSAALPVSHTCFNILDLPVTYESKDVLRERLLYSLEHAQGFGLV